MHFNNSRWDDFIKIKIWTWATIWWGIVLMDWMVLWKLPVNKVWNTAALLSFPYNWCPSLFSHFSIIIRNSMDPIMIFILNFSAGFKNKDGFVWRRSRKYWRTAWWALSLIDLMGEEAVCTEDVSSLCASPWASIGARSSGVSRIWGGREVLTKSQSCTQNFKPCHQINGHAH